MAPKVNLVSLIRNILAPKSGEKAGVTANVRKPLLSFDHQSEGRTTLGYEGSVSNVYIPDEIVSGYASVVPEFPSRKGVDNLDLSSPELAQNPTFKSDIQYHSALSTVPKEPEYSEV